MTGGDDDTEAVTTVPAVTPVGRRLLDASKLVYVVDENRTAVAVRSSQGKFTDLVSCRARA